MKRLAVVLALPLLIAAVAPQENFARKFGLPGSDMGTVAGVLMEAVVRGDESFTREVIETHYAPEFRDAFPMQQHLGIFAQLHDALPDLAVRGASRTGPSSAEFVLESEETGRRVRMEVALGENNLVTSMMVQPDEEEAPAFTATTYEQLDRELEALAGDGQFAGVVMDAPAGEPAFLAAYGPADKRSGTNNTPETRFNIGSLNKGLTGAAVLLLTNEGRIELDAPLGTYLEGFPPDVAGKVTVRQLLQHRSGWGQYWDNEDFLSRLARLRTMDDYLDFLRDVPLDFEPGTREQYSNTGYEILGGIIEAASGMSYFDFVQQRIFDPLGMTSTAFIERDEVARDVAIGYASEHPFLAGEPYSRENSFLLAPKGTAAGGAFSTAADLQRFWLGLVDGDLLPPAQAAMVLGGYGDDSVMPQQAVVLAGGAPGVMTILYLDPATRDFSVALCNYDTPLAEEVLRHLRTLR